MSGRISPYFIPSVKMHPAPYSGSSCRRRVWPLRVNSAFALASAPLLPLVRGSRSAGRNLNGRSSLRSDRPSARPTKHDHRADFEHSARRPAGVP